MIEAIKWASANVSDNDWRYHIWFKCPCGKQNRMAHSTAHEEKICFFAQVQTLRSAVRGDPATANIVAEARQSTDNPKWAKMGCRKF